MNVYQRINEVRKLCPFIKKDKRVDGQGYMAVTHDNVTSELRDHLIEQGIVIVPRLKESKVVDTGTTTAKGIPIIRYEAKFDVDFVNMDDPQDKVTVPNEAHANDQGDKAPGKATSYATKYAMLKLFSIETGEEEESRVEAKSGTKDLAKQIAYANVKPTAGLMEQLTEGQRVIVRDIATEVIDCFEAGAPDVAYGLISEAGLDTDEKAALWTLFDSKIRSALKKIGETKKPPLPAQEPREKDLARAEAKGTA
jgi:hypothetical protein